MSRRITIFGREPAVVLAFVASVVSLLGAYVVHFDTDQQGALNGVAAAIVGVLTAMSLRDGSLATVLVGLAKAVIYVALAWHFNISADNQALILTAVSTFVALFGIRPQVVVAVGPKDQPPVSRPLL